MTAAVLDLGTNTFNLLIAKITGSGFESVYNEKFPVKLGSGGIHKRQISPEAFERALMAMKHYRTVIDKYQPDIVKAYGTSALRSTENGKILTSHIRTETGISVEVIDGKREASLIFKGISAAISLPDPYLVMDIGGGSVEFILARRGEKIWAESFPLGIARLLEQFQPSDPLTEDDCKQILSHIEKVLNPLWNTVRKVHPETLVGASGTFDSLYSMALANRQLPADEEVASHEIPLAVFELLYTQLISSKYTDRLKMPGLVPYRADMIVVATIFVNFVLSRLKITRLIHTGYALKEGVITELMPG